MQRNIMIFLIIIRAIMYTGTNSQGLAKDNGITSNTVMNFDKMKYEAEQQKYYKVTILKAWTAPWQHDNGESKGIFIKAACDKKSYLIPVAPCWYFNDIDWFENGKQFIIAGVASAFHGENIILPKSIKKDNIQIWLRNYDGKTFWDISTKNDNHFQRPGGPKDRGDPPGRSPQGGGGMSPF